ncbi:MULTISPECIES: PadR family transcriptional regulator [unclassified Streptomyces]|uniref:PadR family transcriptional regulator n=1 Tax=unclassified Streptomyces TaxID=2593676 RepID=UPI0022B63E11|nr:MULTISPECIES: PadR family transcriptional regulator [unclassified Streptomyces]MCZ7416588.1 PadR family transcriptional regulator [Streptomyces sp. WMMC897]MCZ7433602.1 PadR family transcriptional regulator [Streptomyces sp. WMMC1477]
MPPVFAHGRLRLYLLKLLAEAPRHGYEVIRLLEERFRGLYAPSAGTVYPRLAKLEAEGLVTHTTEGGRKVYSLTPRGRAELAGRQGELTELEREIHDSLTALAAEIREDVRGSADDLRREMREAAEGGGTTAGGERAASGHAGRGWKEEARRGRADHRQIRQEKIQAAQEEGRKARQEAQRAAQEEVRRIARQVQDRVSPHAQSGDWQRAVREGMAQLAKEMGGLGRTTGQGTAWPPPFGTPPGEPGVPHRPQEPRESPAAAEPPEPEWPGEAAEPGTDPARALERLLDRFRDEVRDASRDHGVTPEQLREVRRHLSTAAAQIAAALRAPR